MMEVTITSKMRKKMLFLKRRLSWLEARTAINEGPMSFDHEEISVIKWVIDEITQIYPELAKVEYKGDL